MDAEDLVPDDFDLDAALNAPTSTAREDLPECPECGSSRISPKGSRGGRWKHPEDYWCKACGAHFDDPFIV